MAEAAMEEALKRGEELFSRQLLEEAEAVFRDILNKEPQHCEALNNIGVICNARGDGKEAERFFARALDANQEHLDALSNLAELYRSTGRQDKEAECLEKIIALMPDDHQSRTRLALLYVEMINPNQTAQTPKTFSDDPPDRHPHGGIESISTKDNLGPETVQAGSISNSADRTNQLDKDIKKLFQKKNFKALLETIQKRVQAREYDKVVAICDRWLDTEDHNTGLIHYFLAVAANATGDFEKANQHHLKALNLDKSLADIKHRKTGYKKTYNEKIVDCIGCDNDGFETVNVSNQSISEDNKGLINPIRRWVRCTRCSLIYANPLPDEATMNRYYSVIAGEKFGGIYGNIDDRFEFSVSMANRRLEKIERYSGGPKTILDIGAGIGLFVGTAADRGWQAEGLELTPEDCEYAKKHFDLELKQENFYSFDATRTYDVVTLFEVIEHLRKPLKDLRRINTLLKSGGLFVLATPIEDTIYGKKTKEHNPFWNVVSHLSYFTRPVMIDYLRKAGFEVMEICGSMEGMGRMEFYCKRLPEPGGTDFGKVPSRNQQTG